MPKNTNAMSKIEDRKRKKMAQKEYRNIIYPNSREEFREWFNKNSETEKECYLPVKKEEPKDNDGLYYLDAVEEALCFGWIDSTITPINGTSYQRFSPRRKASPWTELNKERVRRLIKLGLMTEKGKKVLPPLGPRSFQLDKEVVAILKEKRIWTKFKSFHPLYQRIRVSNIAFHRERHPATYEKYLNHFIEETRKGNIYGNWNDYGRLLDY